MSGVLGNGSLEGLPENNLRAESRPNPIMVEFRNLSLSFAGAGETVDVLEDINIGVGDCEFIAIIGPSGCGKSTLLKLAAGLISATRGECRVFGGVPTPDGRVAYMSQGASLLPWSTALENVALPLRASGASRLEARQKASALLDQVHLNGFEKRYPSELSTGMQKRVQLARTLAQDAGVTLMDEPFGALDAQTRLQIQQLFLKMWENQRKTVLFVTHDLQEAIYLADRVITLSARPAHVIDAVSVCIERPRNFSDLIGSEEFQELHRRLWGLLAASEPT
jgi:NitT/TauT family transport system ATP-binding protein